MIELHGLYGLHIGMPPSLRLWRKIGQLRRQGKKVLFIGIENASAHKSKEPALQTRYQADRAHMQRQLAIGGIRVQDVEIGPKSLTLFAEALCDPIPEDLEEQHGLFTHVVAGLHDLPLHALEYAGKKTVKKTRRLFRRYQAAEQRLNELVQPQADVDDVLRQVRRFYFDSTDMGSSRHKDVVKNIARLARRPEYKKDGAIVLQFGGYHLGLEKYLEEELKKKGVLVRAVKPEPFGRNPTLLDELVEKRVRNPRFKPTGDEIARATLHFWIASGNSAALVQKSEAVIKKMPIEKVKETLARWLKQDSAAVNALLFGNRKGK